MAADQPNNSQRPGDDIFNGNHQQRAANAENIADGNTWDEEQLEKAMKTLKEMHIQLRGLRSTIPRMIAPLSKKQSSPEALFREFVKSGSTANQEVQDFHRLMNQEESKKVLEHAKLSRAENPKGIKPWRVAEHEDWLTKDS